GYVEQLYTFGDRGRHAQPGDTGPHVVSIGYLALSRPEQSEASGAARWRSWYDFFPWEDWRKGKPEALSDVLEPLLLEWAQRPANGVATERPVSRLDRLRIAFGMDGGAWDEEKVLERYELIYEAGLADEAHRDGREAAFDWNERPRLGAAMKFDHRRILATSIGRTRAKIKYRPVVFELMPPEFTLFELQKTVEAILGPHLHKQNFRRLVESAGLVEPTGDVRVKTGGRPAKLYRFRREVLLERPAPGVRIKAARG
ncbi:MAG: NAD regulator, partial [Hyphomicrobiaceae bacterium]|nr:NAD regulator [Hyphomicrobiaceae bacterium]